MAAINAILGESTPDERAETYKASTLQAYVIWLKAPHAS